MSDEQPRPTDIREGSPPGMEPVSDDRSPDVPSIRLGVEPDAMEIFFAWEKLRLAYNALLAIIVLSMAGKAVIPVLIHACWAGPIANLMFCAGPVSESYLVWLFGAPRPIARWVVFGLGLAVSIAVTIAAVVEVKMQFPG